MPDAPLFTMISETGFSLQTSLLEGPITVRKAAEFDRHKIINRSSPVLTFANSEPITFNVVLRFLALGKKSGGGGWDARDIERCVKGLFSLTFPQQASTMPPPICYVTLGSGLFMNSYACVLDTVDRQWGGNIYDKNGDPIFATVTLSFTGLEILSQSGEDFAGDAVSTYEHLSFE